MGPSIDAPNPPKFTVHWVTVVDYQCVCACKGPLSLRGEVVKRSVA